MDTAEVGEGSTPWLRRNETAILNDVPLNDFDPEDLGQQKHEGKWIFCNIWRSIPSPNCDAKLFFIKLFLVLHRPQKKQAGTSPDISKDALRCKEEAPTHKSEVGHRRKVPLIYWKPWSSSIPGCIRQRVEITLVVTSHRPIPILPALSLPILLKTPVWLLLKLQRPTQMSNPHWRHPAIHPLQDPGISSINLIHGERITLAKVQRINCFLV